MKSTIETRPRPRTRLLPVPRIDAEKLGDELRRQIRGEVRFDDGDRALYATDASNYRQVPIGVVVPRDVEDVVRTVEVARRFNAPVLPRGGGTSLAGQCCNVAVVIDLSKYVNRVLEMDPERRRARVEPGTILDDLREAAEVHGLTFGPDPSTHAYCTLGGMIGNNSCGTHSVLAEFYGPGARTEHSLEELEVLTYDGLRLRVGPTPEPELERIIGGGGRRGEIYGRLRDLRDRYAELIRQRFPQIPRRVSGYNLDQLLPENGFHVARALAGTEGTCVTVLEATVTLIPSPRARSLLVLGYPSVYEAADHVPELREFRPIGMEGIDRELVRFMESKGMHPEEVALLPEGDGWLMVEFGGRTEEEAHERCEAAAAALQKRRRTPAMRIFDDPATQSKIWEIRESGLGATAFVPGEPPTWEGWEDAAVPIEALGDYLRDFRDLLDRYDYRASLYGHFGHGCVHTRIPFDLESAEGIAKFHAFTREAAELVAGKYGGSISGEHGDGQSRGDLLEVMYGPELVEAFREFKAIWDPQAMMNPGKLVEAYPRDEGLRLGADYRPAEPSTHFRYPDDDGSFAHAALRCVGVGKCRRLGGGTMCPSFMVLREEKHTTRGRAHLLFEMLQGEAITDGWRSEEVKEALDLCLSCKGCKGECPVNVDIATYKAEFLSHYYAGRLRPRSAYAFGLVYWWARFASHVPALANSVTRTPVLREVAKAAAGMPREREVPPFAPRTFKAWWRDRAKREPARGDVGHEAPPAPERVADASRPRVILWPDTFNNHFQPQTLAAGAEVLEQAGCRVLVPEAALCCGRPLYEYGMLDLAKRQLRRILAELRPEIDAGVPVVGLEPSCVAVFRDELRELFPKDELAMRLHRQTFMLGEFLAQQIEGYRPPQLQRKALVHGHCHHKAIMTLDGEVEVLSRLGLDLDLPASGCCGMAGSFGYEKEKYGVSMGAGEHVLLPAVRNAEDDTLIIADGFSCRGQISHGTERRGLHLAEVIQLGLHQDRLDEALRPEDQAQRLAPPTLVESPRPSALTAVTLGAAALAGGALAWKFLRR